MAETATRTKQATSYKILRSVDGGANWQIVATKAAVSADVARQKTIATESPALGATSKPQYVAVPVRSWQPVTPEQEIKTITKLVPVVPSPQGNAA